MKFFKNISGKITHLHNKLLFSSNFYERIYFYLNGLYRKFDKDHLWVLSSSIAFNLIICILPFLLILLTILGIYLDASNALIKLSDYLNNILPVMPDFKDKVISTLIDKTRELTSNTFLTGAIGIIGLFWTTSGLFSSMRDVMYKVYDLYDDTNYFLSKLKDFFLVLLTLILVLVSISATSIFQLLQFFSEWVFGQEIILSFVQSLLSALFTLIVTFLLFYTIYKHVPHFNIPRKVAFVSSLTAAILFEILKFAYTYYLLNFSNFSKIYGTFGVIVATLLWIYYVSVIFVIGAQTGNLYVIRNKLQLQISKK